MIRRRVDPGVTARAPLQIRTCPTQAYGSSVFSFYGVAPVPSKFGIFPLTRDWISKYPSSFPIPILNTVAPFSPQGRSGPPSPASSILRGDPTPLDSSRPPLVSAVITWIERFSYLPQSAPNFEGQDTLFSLPQCLHLTPGNREVSQVPGISLGICPALGPRSARPVRPL